MKSKRYLLVVLSILMILFVFVSSAGAADANATDVLSVDESSNTINEKLALDYSLDNAVANDTNVVENDEILQNPNSDDDTDTLYVNESADPGGDGSEAKPFNTLNDALNEAQDGNTIMIASGEYKGENNTGLEITKNLNFVKYGDSEAIFDAESLGQIWKFTEKSANITGLTFRNGKTDDKRGGAIYFDNSGGNVVNCTFTGNTASNDAGGAIYMKSGNVTNCTFTDNTAKSGGAIYIGSGNVTNCNFTDNNANNGGAIGSSSSVIIEYCTFTNNTAQTGEGGAIYIYGSGNVNNCNFTGNTAQTGEGGAIYIYNRGNVTNCNFTNNTAYGGGAIYISTGNVNNCNFTDNTAYGSGGAIYFETGSNVVNCTFTNNTAGRNGGAIYMTDGNVNNCTFTNNTAESNGGAIASSRNVIIEYCTFIGNNAKSKFEGGGAIYMNTGNVTNCTFTNNTEQSSQGVSPSQGGGAIRMNTGNVSECTFTGNNGPRYGGAIYFNSYGDVTNCTFTDNKATFMGGAIHFRQQGSVSYCTFTDNNGTSWGGAIAFEGNGNVTNCAFVNNSAKYRNAISCNDPLESAENNWWGSNNPDWKKLIDENKIPSVYAVLNITADPSEISNDETSEIATKFVWNGTTENATSLLPKRNIKLSSNGNLTETEGYVGLTSQFSAADGGIYYVNATVDNEMLGVNIVKIPIPTNINVTITSLNLTVEETSLINATLDPSEAGGLEVDYNETIIKVEQNEVTGEWIVTALAKGKTNITFSFAGSEGYAAAENKTVTVTVNAKPAPSINVVAENLTKYYGGSEQFSVNVTDEEGKGIPYKNVSILINGVNYNRPTDENGIAHLNITLPSGEYVANVTVDDIAVNATVTVLPTVSGSDVRKVYGQKASYNATFLDEEGEYLPNGTEVSFNIGGVIQNETISDDNGLASLNINLPVGNYTVTAMNLVTGEKANNTITVTQAESDIIVNGKNITVSDVNAVIADIVLPGDATGNVSVTIGDNTTVYDVQTSNHTSRGGKLVMFISNNGLNVGEYNISATYEGDTNYKASTASDQFVVSDKKYLNITATADHITVGENATVVVTGLENATGEVSVIIKVDEMYSAPINEGVATVTVPGLTETVTADVIYLGDDKYNPANTTVEIVVNSPGKENLTISASADPITVGENATVVVTGFPLTSYGSPSGNVTVTVGDKTFSGTLAPYMIGGLAAEIIVPGLNETTVAEVNYLGDDKYNPANTTVEIVVNSPGKKNLTISASAEPITVGENATVVVTGFVNEGLASGIVTVTVGDKTFSGTIVPHLIGGAIAEIVVPGLTENVTAEVNYLGDEFYNSASTTVNITVYPKEKENANMSLYAPEIGESENATIYVTLPEDATGTVTATDQGENFTADVVNGTAIIILPVSDTNRTVPVTYSGDDKYNSETKEVNITVVDSSDIIIAPDVTKYYGGPERFVVTVTDYKGNPLVNKSVNITINGRNYTRNTNEWGVASLAINLPSNGYNATVSIKYLDPVHASITVLSTVNGTDVVKMYRNGTQYYATFIDTEGKFLADGTVVKFNINGVVYERKVSGDKGQAKLNINLPAGEYVITAINPVTGENSANNITVLSTVVENRDITKYYRNATQYTVKVLGADGNPVGEGKLVTFNINGVLYQRQTNASSIAQLNINLPPGDYVITASYEGCSVANNITVLPVLKAENLKMKYMDGSKFKATLLDGQGKPYAEQKIQFNVNGVLYSRVTDSNGQAELNIRLLPGEYIITSSYNGCNIANKITITG